MVKDPIAKFWDSYDCLLESGTFSSAIERLLGEIRVSLDNSSKTAKAIDRHKPYKTIARCAIEENLDDLAEILNLSA